jgi:hypothetical protein
MVRGYFTFPTIFQAIKAEKVLSKKDWSFKIVPVPRSISSSCGNALRCQPGDAGAIRLFLQDMFVEIDGYYEL